MAEIKHYGVMGMKWGHRRAGGTNTRVHVGKGLKGAVKEVKGLVKDAAKDDLMKAGKGINRAGKAMKKMDDKIGKAFGMKQRKDGKWIVTPEAQVKAAGIGVALGFASFALELGARKYVASHSAKTLAQSAEYIKWLANG